MNKEKNIIIFNLRTDADDAVLGFTTDWINAIAKKFTRVFVITMVKGKDETAKNVEVFSVGKERGYSELRRIFEFYKILFKILKKNKIDGMFAHMTPEFAILAGPIARLKKIPLILWFAHKSVTWRLKVAVLFVDKLISSTKEGCRLNTRKLIIVGQGIDTAKFKYTKKNFLKLEFFTVGRISKIKNIHKMIHLVKYINEKLDKNAKLFIYGQPLNKKDQKYFEYLKKIIFDNNLTSVVIFKGSVSNQLVNIVYRQHNCFLNFSDTGSLDKAILEALFSGCFVYSINNAFNQILKNNQLEDFVLKKDNYRQMILSLLKKKNKLPSKFIYKMIADNNLVELVNKIKHLLLVRKTNEE